MIGFIIFVVVFAINAAIASAYVSTMKDGCFDDDFPLLRNKVFKVIILIPPLGLIVWVITFIIAMFGAIFENYFKD